MAPLITAISSSRLSMGTLKNILECLVVDDVKIMEFQQIWADVVSEIVLDLAAQGLQQAIPSCLVTLRAPIYLNSCVNEAHLWTIFRGDSEEYVLPRNPRSNRETLCTSWLI